MAANLERWMEEHSLITWLILFLVPVVIAALAVLT